MGDTNFIGSIVKILETPKQNFINKDILFTSFRAQFPQFRKNYVVHLKVWGNLARDVVNFYQTNDYVLIEGYLSLGNSKSSNLANRQSKKIEITVLKIYPIEVGYDRYSDHKI